ncbi:MAG: hypothetical protein FJ202_09735 [Gemmatimonadetes bacterium]|nr:hypothetical protein [Gemmatimonadota bacterium]
MSLRIPLTPEWRSARDAARHAEAFARAALEDPAEDDVLWLSGAAAAGDTDHARWELRYARLALAILVAERGSLSDQVGSDAARAIRAALVSDDSVAPEMRPLAEQQLDERLTAYRGAIDARGSAIPASEMLGRVLLSFASDGVRSAGTPLARATTILAGYVDDANRHLRDAFGQATLPEDLPPSAMPGR